jgi:hypothetical protein
MITRLIVIAGLAFFVLVMLTLCVLVSVIRPI